MATYNVLSLFAGIGGIDLGLERTGRFTTIAYSEVEPYACRIMAQRFENAAPIGDITQCHFLQYRCGTCTVHSAVTEPLAAADQDGELVLGKSNNLVLVGGFPCQDISLAGKGGGIDGERSGLWMHYARAIRALRPRGIIVENVAALLTRGIDRVLRDLAACGYDAEWDCIPAAALGAPHRRDRLFIVAYRTNTSGIDNNAQRNATAANTDSNRCNEGQHWDAIQIDSVQRKNSAGRPSGFTPWNRPTTNQQWVSEPSLDRMVDGVSHRVDRIRCLGNAVVPQVAEHVGRILLDRIGKPHA